MNGNIALVIVLGVKVVAVSAAVAVACWVTQSGWPCFGLLAACVGEVRIDNSTKDRLKGKDKTND